MKSLLKMYLYRLIHSTLFWVCIGLAVVTPIIWVFVEAELNVQLALKGYDPSFSIAALIVSMESFMNWPLVMGPAFVSFFYALEWKDGTFRNQILAGKSRTQIYLSSQLMGFFICFSIFLVNFLITLLLGLAVQMPFFILNATTTLGSAIGTYLVSFFMLFFLGIFVTVVSTSFAFIIHNAWGAFGCLIGFFFFISFVETITNLFESVNQDSYYVFKELLYSYQASRFISLNYDFSDGVYAARVSGRAAALIIKTILSSLFVGGGMGYLGWLSFTKRDLK